MSASLIERLSEEGHKVTKVRRAIADLFEMRHAPLTAAEIGKLLTSKGVRANKTTVYREVEFFRERGLIETVSFGDRNLRYERKDDDHHHHVVCVKCRTVVDVEMDNDLGVHEKAIAKKTGFSILRHTLEFFGLCRECH